MRLLLSALLLTSCAATTWTHPTKTGQERYHDLSKCRAQAGQAMIGVQDEPDLFGVQHKRQAYIHECMQGEGWTPN